MNNPTKPMNPRLQALVAQARLNHAARLAKSGVLTVDQSTTTGTPAQNTTVIKKTSISERTAQVLTVDDSFHKTIPGFDYNEKQMEAIELAMRAKSFNLIGAAGTGKTTTTREVIGQLVKLPHISPLQEGTKWLSKEEPGIVVISFTNKAVNNLKKFLPQELAKHCLTYHKLLQYEPVQYDKVPGDPTSGKTMRFEPTFTSLQPLPHISCIIVEESSMVASELHDVLLRALPDPDRTQFIFLGDLNQLPPIFGPSILGFKLLSLPTVELTHVYRQALESPIITLAHKIREGRGFSDKSGRGKLTTEGFVDDRGEHGIVTINPWKAKQESGNACKVARHFLIKLIEAGKLNVDEDIILCPFNKSFGTLELNRAIADHLGKKREAEVFEVIARYQKSYWAVGDRVLVDRMEARIIKIEATAGYSGPIPIPSSKTLDRWGRDSGASREEEGVSAVDAFNILDSLVVGGDSDDEEQTRNSASHTITIEFVDTGVQKSFSDAGNINGMLFSYVLTVHKAQGSEWKRVFILLHYSHNSMLSRELLYTAVTRARHELFIICEPDKGEVYNSITRAAKSPEIHGVSLAEKAEYFKRKKKEMVKKGKKEQEEIALEEDA
jgi:ATP-dependent exoDNAse (exonuclease V) alpha subunit